MDDLISELKGSHLAALIQFSGSERYRESLASYFSQQEQDLHPALVIIPESTQDVIDIVKTLSKHFDATKELKSKFAVRSGGNAPMVGVANVRGGVTIDLCKLNRVTLVVDRKTVEIESGARWGDIYPVLDKVGLGIAGGRDASIGVGGLTLGGGLTYFSPQRGFVCDDVVSFEGGYG